ncbi:zinc finger SWIM domain-containing protein 8-like [Sinocyclocheilus grahami]|uniref:zinc finger SWIM domain-containing protein 8-like n=1 Tax=Sinocyclocheilus grahami TaxID=75366 RepID=UPI0007AD2EFE|nr:PREDICTED: zinc finger SWIM domain-containing protein 8-like [Sinocyclocheilus grahami]
MLSDRGVHSGSTIQAIQGTSFPGLSSQPASLVSAPFPVEDEQHNQPISQQGLHYLHSAYRVGMLALEMLGRRAHNDHPNNFSRSPPYTEDVKWLLGLAARLADKRGENLKRGKQTKELWQRISLEMATFSP